MSKSVDTRVVEMRFDNKNFESGVKQSLSTLERLKAALKTLTTSNKGMNVLGDAAKTSKSSLDQIAQSVSALEKRFSFLGETVRNVANKMRDTITGTIGSAVNYVKDGIVQGGIKRAMNIENAHYQLQALLKDEAEVQKVMDNAMESVDGTAYGFDEAAKAAAMFKASGIETGEAMTNALKGIAGTAAMTNAEYERISLIFTSVAGQGRLMGDQLLQLSSLGLNAPASIATFFNETNQGVSKASDSVAKAVKKISGGAKVTEKDIRELVTDGEISFQIFAEAMYSAFGESAERANETFNGSLSNMRAALARIGAEFVSPLIEQNSSVILLINKLKDKINEVKKSLTFSEEAGNIEAYSKRFTDAVLGMADSLGTWVENLDVASGMKVFYNVVDGLINICKALWSVIKPIGQAFADVFLSFKVDAVIAATGAFKSFTESLILSEKSSKNLHDAFEGVFSVIKLVVDGVVGLLSAILNVNPPIGLLSDGLLGVVGAIGRGITAFTNWIRECTLVKKAMDGIRSVSKIVGNAIRDLVNVVKSFIDKAIEMKVVEKVVGAVLEAFRALGEFAAPYIDAVSQKIKEFVGVIKEWAASSLGNIGEKLQETFQKIWDVLSNLTMDDVKNQVSSFQEVFKSFMDTFGGGFSQFINNVKEFGERVREAFNFDKVVDNIRTFKDLVQEFADWFKSTIGSVFGDVSIGGAVAGAGGIGIIYAIINISKSLDKAMEGLSSLPKLLGAVTGTMKTLQADLKADALKRSAEAILILAGALVVLSFTDTDKALEASVALSAIASVLMIGTTKLVEAMNAGRSLSTQINYFAKGLGKAMNNLSKAVKWKAIGSAFKDFGASILMIAGSLIALGIMYRKDADALKQAEIMVGVIGGVMVVIMAAMVAVEKLLSVSGSGAMKSAIGVLAIAGALTTVVGALKKMLKIELPSDYKEKFGMMELMLGSLGLVAVALGLASQIAGSARIKSGPIIALAVSLKICVSALNDVFKIDMEKDFVKKIAVFTLMFVELGALIGALAYATKLAGGTLKATGTLVAMALDIAVITGALMILQMIPGEKLLSGSVALAGVLVGLAVALAGAGEVVHDDTSKTVLNMAITIGAIAAAIGVLAFLPWEKLTAGTLALGAILGMVALDLYSASKITNDGIWKTITAMVGVVVSIGATLTIMATQPWESILAAGVSLSATMATLAGVFAIISKSNPNQSAIIGFVACAVALIPISAALLMISGQSWESIIPGAASMLVVAGSLSAILIILSKANPSVGAIAAFVAASLSLIPIAAALNMLAGQTWSSIIPGAASLGIVVGSISAAMLIMSKAGVGIIAGVAGFVAGALAILPISEALKMLAGESWGSILPGAVSLGAVVVSMAASMALMSSVGLGVLAGVVGFVGAAIALKPIAEVIKKLSGLTWDEVAHGLVALAGGLTVIGVAGVAGTAIAPGLLALSAALVVFAAGIAAVGAALPIFVDGLTVAVQALGNFLSDLGGAVSQMAEAGKNLMLGLLQGIVSGVQSVIEGVKSVADGIVNTVKGVLGIHSPSTVFEALGINVDEGFAQGLLGGQGTVDGAVDNVFSGLAEKIDLEGMLPKGEEGASLFGDGLLSGEGNIDSIMNQLADSSGTDLSSFTATGQEGVSNLGDGMQSGQGDIDKILKQLTDATGTDTTSFNTLGKDTTAKYGAGLKSGEGNVKNTVKQITDASKTDVNSYTNLGKKAANNFATGVKSGAKSASSGAASSVAKTLQQAIQNAVKGTNFAASGKEISNAIAKGIKGDQAKVKSAVDAVLKAANTAIKQQNNTFKTAGAQTINQYAAGVKSKTSVVSDSIKGILKKMTTEIKSTNKDFKSKGEDIVTNLVKGIKTKQRDATKIVKDIAAKMVKQLNSAAKDFQKPGKDSATQYTKAMKTALESSMKSIVSTMTTRGKQLVQGLAKGINANAGVARSAASKLAQQIDQQIKKDLDIHSPSKVAEKRGKQVVEGFANGISKNTGKATDAVGKLTKTTKDALGLGLKNIKKMSETYLTDNYLTNYIKKTVSTMKEDMNKEFSGVEGWVAQWMMKNTGYKYQIQSEDDYWKRLLEIKQQGAEKEKYLAMDIKTFREEMLESYQSIMDEYHQTIAQEQENVFGQVNMFEEVDKSLLRTRQEQADHDYKVAKKEEAASKQREKSGETDKQTSEVKREVIATMAETFGQNNKLLTSYEKNLKKAEKRLKGSNLWEFLKEQGIESLPKLKEINKMNDKEVKELIKSWDDGLATAFNIATIKMGDVTAQTKKNIDEMFSINEEGIKNGEAQKQRGLTAEEQYWSKLLITKKAGVDQEKYLDMDLKTFRESVLEETNQIIQDYQSQFESTRDNIMSQMGLFDEVTEKTVKSQEELLAAMQSQVTAYAEYNDTMDSLVKRLQGTNLLAEIQKMGVSSLDELKVINGMTDEQLSEYANLYDQKLAEAGEAANRQLGETKEKTEQQLKDLFGAASDINIDEFTEKFDGTLESLDEFLMGMMETMTEQTVGISEAVTDMATNMTEALSNGMSEFESIATEGASGLGEALVKGIGDSGEQAAEAASKVSSYAAKAIQEEKGDFQSAGQKLGAGYAQGINKTQNEAKNSGTTLATKTIAGIDSKAQTFTTEGTKEGANYSTGLKEQFGNAQQSGTGLADAAISGINSKSSEFQSAGSNMASQAASGLNNGYYDFYDAGQNAGRGFVQGIESQISAARAAAQRLADAAASATKKSLEVKSPSRVMMAIGNFAGEGFINGILQCVAKAGNASEELGEAAQNGVEGYLHGLSNIVSDDLITNPVIRPEVDLTNVHQSIADINKLFNAAIKMTASDAIVIDTGITANRKRTTDQAPIQRGGRDDTTEGNTFNLIQNNYSPKPLSRSEIYRQTRNQFNLFKTAVSGV